MKVEFIGVGSAFSKVEYVSNLLLHVKDDSLTVDFGSTASRSLHEKDISLKTIKGIFITHLHADHVGGLEELALLSRLRFKTKPLVISPPSLLHDLWNKSLRGGLEYIEERPGDETLMTLGNYFEEYPVASGQWCSHPNWPDLSFCFVENDHIRKMESYGIIFRFKGKKIFYSGDTRFHQDYIEKYGHDADFILHDCQLHETGPNNTLGVHTSLAQLKTLPKKLKNKIWLYHHATGQTIPDVEGEFAGFATRNLVFEL